MELSSEVAAETHALLTRLRAFCFPGGEDRARLVSSIRTTERGEMRASPGAPMARLFRRAGDRGAPEFVPLGGTLSRRKNGLDLRDGCL